MPSQKATMADQYQLFCHTLYSITLHAEAEMTKGRENRRDDNQDSFSWFIPLRPSDQYTCDNSWNQAWEDQIEHVLDNDGFVPYVASGLHPLLIIIKSRHRPWRYYTEAASIKAVKVFCMLLIKLVNFFISEFQLFPTEDIISNRHSNPKEDTPMVDLVTRWLSVQIP